MFHHVSINKIYFIVENNFCVNNGYVVEHIEQIRTLLRRRDVIAVIELTNKKQSLPRL